jgi:hypothetical protein
LREVPDVTLWIFGAVTARAVKRVLRLLDDSGAGFDGLRVVPVDVRDVDIQVLRCVTDQLRSLEVGPGAAEHQQRLAELHLGMRDPAPCVSIRPSGRPQAERLGQPRQRRAGVPIQQVRCDRHATLFEFAYRGFMTRDVMIRC